MKNLDQIRAYNALQHKDNIADSKGGGDAISGFPMLVLTDGLLAALAFACEWKKQGERKNLGEHTVATAIASHLHDAQISISKANDADGLLKELAEEKDDILLRRATTESLAFLNYLKRFVA